MSKKKGRPAKKWNEVLIYRKVKRRSDVGPLRRAFLEYRQANKIQYRCDVEQCPFNVIDKRNFDGDNMPIWRNARLPLTIDHINGNWRDNRPENLRLLCPNCMFQQPTHAGGNKGRVVSSDDWGFVLKGTGGSRHFFYFATGTMKIGGSAKAEVKS